MIKIVKLFDLDAIRASLRGKTILNNSLRFILRLRYVTKRRKCAFFHLPLVRILHVIILNVSKIFSIVFTTRCEIAP
jgi:hypothetical protein